jgi:NAD-dependent dihydropyrimidine dehydrogenase PreA subunit
MTYVIAEPCVGVKDAACVEACPVSCIYEGDDQYYIRPDECIDCDACEPVCPVEAIFRDDSVPEQWLSFTDKNKVFFAGAASSDEQPAPTVEPAAQDGQVAVDASQPEGQADGGQGDAQGGAEPAHDDDTQGGSDGEVAGA